MVRQHDQIDHDEKGEPDHYPDHHLSEDTVRKRDVPAPARCAWLTQMSPTAHRTRCFRLAALSPGQTGLSHDGLRETSSVQVSPPQIRSIEIRSPQIGSIEISTSQIGFLQARLAQAGPTQVGLSEICMGQIRCRDIGVAEIRSPEPGADTDGLEQVALSKVRSNELRSGKIGSCEVNVSHIDSRQVSLAQVRLTQVGIEGVNKPLVLRGYPLSTYSRPRPPARGNSRVLVYLLRLTSASIKLLSSK